MDSSTMYDKEKTQESIVIEKVEAVAIVSILYYEKNFSGSKLVYILRLSIVEFSNSKFPFPFFQFLLSTE